MKKIIALVAATVLFAVFSIVNVSGGKLPSVGYVLVGPKNDGGWSMRHSQGFDILTKYGYKYLKSFGETSVYKNIAHR